MSVGLQRHLICLASFQTYTNTSSVTGETGGLNEHKAICHHLVTLISFQTCITQKMFWKSVLVFFVHIVKVKTTPLTKGLKTFDLGVHLSRLICTDTGRVRYRPQVSGKSCLLLWFGLFSQTVPWARSVLFDPEGWAFFLTQQHSFSRVQAPQKHTHWVRTLFICLMEMKMFVGFCVYIFTFLQKYSSSFLTNTYAQGFFHELSRFRTQNTPCLRHTHMHTDHCNPNPFVYSEKLPETQCLSWKKCV